MTPFLIVLAILPGIAICVYIYYLDKYEREEKLPLGLSFLLGVLITYPVMKLQQWLLHFHIEDPYNLLLTLFSSIFIVALSEELIKLLAVLAFPFGYRFFNEPMDGIIYTVMTAMGFATLENLVYADQFGLETTLLRAFTAVPAHAIFAVVLGYYIGLAKFSKGRKAKLLIVGLAQAVAFHGIYDFFILQEVYDGFSSLAVVSLVVGVFYGRNLIRKHQENSPFK